MMLRGQFLVDATGRASRIARLLGAQRISLDKLVGYYAIVDRAPSTLAAYTFVEAVPEGWWYAAAIPGERAVISFMSDPDLHNAVGSLQDFIYAQLKNTRHLRQHFPSITPKDLTSTQVKNACTSTLNRITGDAWLAVGDAAVAYDPLTSYGITAAVGGSIYAANAIRAHLTGESAALHAYTYLQQKTLSRCLEMLKRQYVLEARWSDAVFWERRA